MSSPIRSLDILELHRSSVIGLAGGLLLQTNSMPTGSNMVPVQLGDTLRKYRQSGLVIEHLQLPWPRCDLFGTEGR